jgi:predicted SAM-dependent methyltransferase
MTEGWSGRSRGEHVPEATLDSTASKRLTNLEQGVKRLEGAWRGQIPSLLESIAKLNHRQLQIDINQNEPDLREAVEYLLGRVEFVRRELMYELQHRTGSPGTRSDALSTEPRVLAADKVAAARRDGLRLNLGCGHIPLKGYVNTDMRELPGVDVVAEVDRLPFLPGEVEEIFSSHLLEHFPQEQLRRELLPYWRSLLKLGGILRCVTPDAEAMIHEYEAGRYSYRNLREVLYGAQEHEGDFHFNIFTSSYICDLFQKAGFRNVRIVAAGRRNGNAFELEVEAKREED